MARVVDVDDPRLADYRDLPDPARARRPDVFVAEGALLVDRLIAAPRFALRSVLCTQAALARLGSALDERRPGTPVYVAPEALLRRVVGYHFHRGTLAAAVRPAESDVETVVAAARASGRPLVLLDNVTNPDNVGGTFRNARAFGAAGVLLAGGCGDPLHRKALRVSMGSAFAVPYARVLDIVATLGRLHAAGLGIVALTPDAAAVDVADFARPGPLVLCLGAERDGLGSAVRAAADLAVRIAMAPGADSLNVATAAAIALHRLLRQPGIIQ